MLKKRILIAVGAIAAALVLAVLAVGPTTLKRWAYEEPGRDRWQQPRRVVEALHVRTGESIADVGAGGGYFTFLLAEATGSDGTVYAADTDAGLSRYVEAEAEKRGLHNVQTVRARPDDPMLPEPVDLMFLSNTAHHFSDRTAWFRNARRYLAPEARVGIVDYVDKHRSPPAEVLIEEMAAAGYELEERFDFLDRQYFLVFSVNR